MTRGLLAGVFFGVLVAALLLAVTVLQLESRRAPERVVMIPPEVMVVFGTTDQSDNILSDPNAPASDWGTLGWSLIQAPTTASRPAVADDIVQGGPTIVPVPDKPKTRSPVVSEAPQVLVEVDVRSPQLGNDDPPVIANDWNRQGVGGVDAPVAPEGNDAELAFPLLQETPLGSAPTAPEIAALEANVSDQAPKTGGAFPKGPGKSAVVVAPDLQPLPTELSGQSQPEFVQPPLPAEVFGPAAVTVAGPENPKPSNQGQVAIVLQLGDQIPNDLPDWALSVVVSPKILKAAKKLPGIEVLPKVPAGADRGVLSRLAWDMASLEQVGPLYVTVPLASDEAAQDLFGLAVAADAGLLVEEGGLSLLGEAKTRGVSMAPGYSSMELVTRLNRSAQHASRDGAVIVVVEDSATARATINRWLARTPKIPFQLVSASQALSRLQSPQ